MAEIEQKESKFIYYKQWVKRSSIKVDSICLRNVTYSDLLPLS